MNSTFLPFLILVRTLVDEGVEECEPWRETGCGMEAV